jgi:hypothetical protein
MNTERSLLLITIISISLLVLTLNGATESQEENTVQVIFYMDTGLGGPIIIDWCSGSARIGENISCTVKPQITYDNDTKIVFEGWYKNIGNGRLELVTEDNSITIKVGGEQTQREYIAKYKVYYLVDLDIGYQIVSEWRPRYSSYLIKVLESWNPEEGIRKIFLKWVGDITGSNPTIYIDKITRPLRAKAVWQTQYYVEIISEYPLSIESGWFNENQAVHIKPLNPVIYENNGETKVLLEKYFIDYWWGDREDSEVDKDSFELVVDSPLTIKAFWKKLHHVVLESDYVKPILLDEWIRDGDKLIFNQLEKEINWNNNTKIVFDKWVNDISSPNKDIEVIVSSPIRAHAIWRVYYLVSVESSEPDIKIEVNTSGWVEKGSNVKINATPIERDLGKGVKALFREWSGSIIRQDPVIEVSSLNQPIIIKALWIRKYLITVDAPDEAGIEKEAWILEDEEHNIIAPIQVSINNSTRIVFNKWVGCSSVRDNVCTLSNVKQPLTVKATYFIERKMKIEAVSLNNEIIEDVYFIVKHESGEIKKLPSQSIVWMKIGYWVIENATWREYDVTSTREFKVTEDSSELLEVLVRIYRLSFKINDYLGFPVRDAVVIIKTIDGKIMYEGRTDENGSIDSAGPLPPVDMIAYISYMGYQIVKNVNMKTSSPIYITIPLSQTSIQLITITIIAGASLTTLAIIRRLRKPREIPIEIPIPLEPTPRRRSIDETIKEREVKKGPVVTLEDIIEKLKESGEKPEEILGELAEKVEKEKKQKRRRRKTTSFQ